MNYDLINYCESLDHSLNAIAAINEITNSIDYSTRTPGTSQNQEAFTSISFLGIYGLIQNFILISLVILSLSKIKKKNHEFE